MGLLPRSSGFEGGVLIMKLAIKLSLNSRHLPQKSYSQLVWFEPDDCSRVAIYVVSFAINLGIIPLECCN